MAKERIPRQDAEAIRERLDNWVAQSDYRSWYGLCRRKGFHTSTAAAWRREDDPVPPSTYVLWRLAVEDGLDPLWLLTGKRTPGERPLKERLREQLVAYFASTLRWPRPRVERYLPEPDQLWRFIGSGVGNAIGRADLLCQSYARLRRPRRQRARAERDLIQQAWDQALAPWRPSAVPADIVFVPSPRSRTPTRAEREGPTKILKPKKPRGRRGRSKK